MIIAKSLVSDFLNIFQSVIKVSSSLNFADNVIMNFRSNRTSKSEYGIDKVIQGINEITKGHWVVHPEEETLIARQRGNKLELACQWAGKIIFQFVENADYYNITGLIRKMEWNWNINRWELSLLDWQWHNDNISPSRKEVEETEESVLSGLIRHVHHVFDTSCRESVCNIDTS